MRDGYRYPRSLPQVGSSVTGDEGGHRADMLLSTGEEEKLIIQNSRLVWSIR